MSNISNIIIVVMLCTTRAQCTTHTWVLPDCIFSLQKLKGCFNQVVVTLVAVLSEIITQVRVATTKGRQLCGCKLCL